jgi:hypothetical protein
LFRSSATRKPDHSHTQQLVAGGHPVLAMVYFYYNSTSTGTLYYFGHFRVIYSYNDNTQTLQPIYPWGRDGVPSMLTLTPTARQPTTTVVAHFNPYHL